MIHEKCASVWDEIKWRLSGPLGKWGEIGSSCNHHMIEMVWKLHEDVLVLPLSLCTLLLFENTLPLFFVDKYLLFALVLVLSVCF